MRLCLHMHQLHKGHIGPPPQPSSFFFSASLVFKKSLNKSQLKTLILIMQADALYL
jgi:hypothetical protein